MGLKFFVDAAETDVKNFQVSGIDTVTGKVVTEDHWIELRMTLSDREWSELDLGAVSGVNDKGEVTFDFASAPTKKMMMWVKAWSLYDRGNPSIRVRPTEEFLSSLDRDIAEQIRAIIDDHAAARKAAREVERNPTPLSAETESASGDSETAEASSSRTRRPARGGS